MWYLIFSFVFVSLGVGLAIWVARERKLKNDALLKLLKAEVQVNEYFLASKTSAASCFRLKEEIVKFEETIVFLKEKISNLQSKLLNVATVEDVRKILNESMKEEEL
jgi:hypothetical protein